VAKIRLESGGPGGGRARIEVISEYQAILRSKTATAPVLLCRLREPAGLPCSSAALRMVELLVTSVAQHPMAVTARSGIDILDAGMAREIPEETSQEYAKFPFTVPLLDLEALAEENKWLGKRNTPSLSNHEEARGAEAYRDDLGWLTNKREIPWLQIHSDIIETDDLALLPICARLVAPDTCTSLLLHVFSTPSSNIHVEIKEWASRELARIESAAHIDADLDFFTPSCHIHSRKREVDVLLGALLAWPVSDMFSEDAAIFVNC
jgi:hypothetical protein